MTRTIQVEVYPDAPSTQRAMVESSPPLAASVALPECVLSTIAREVYLDRLRTLHTDAHHLAVLVSTMQMRDTPTDPTALDGIVDTADAIMHTVERLTS